VLRLGADELTWESFDPVRETHMVELVVLACLVKNPLYCEEFPIPFLQPMRIAQCVYQGHLRTMQWATEHPDWVIKRWTCGLPRT
jgi:hypothetical protein